MYPSTSVIIGATATRSDNRQDGCSFWHPSTPLTAAAGVFIFMSAGMNLALGLGWNQYSVFGPLEHFRFSWFIGMIVGTIFSLPLRYYIPKRFIMVISAVLILIEGILFTSVPDNNDALLVGRYLNGIAVGLATITFLMHASEIAGNSYRGSCLALEQYALTFGLAIQMIYTCQWGPTITFPANRVHGILDIIFAVLAGGLLYFFIESPVDYICKDDEAAALAAVTRLQWPKPVTTAAAKSRLEELKMYVREQQGLTLQESLERGALPLVKMVFFRSMMLAFTFSLPLSIALQYSVLVNLTTWPPIVAGCLRILGCFIADVQVDYLGRKLPSLFCTVVIGALIVGIGGICYNYQNILDDRSMSIVTALCLLIQFFAGFFAPFTSTYMGEAFSLQVKPYFMAVCVIVEQIIHIIVICTFGFINSAVFLATGIMILIVFAGMCVCMPETRKTTLLEAQERFRHLLQLKMC